MIAISPRALVVLANVSSREYLLVRNQLDSLDSLHFLFAAVRDLQHIDRRLTLHSGSTALVVDGDLLEPQRETIWSSLRARYPELLIVVRTHVPRPLGKGRPERRTFFVQPDDGAQLRAILRSQLHPFARPDSLFASDVEVHAV